MSFSGYLLNKYTAIFTKATTHSLTTELCKGTLSDDRLLVYLLQDLNFFQHGIRVTCKAAALCDDNEAQIKLAKQIGFFANDENDYFQVAIDELSAKYSVEQLQNFKSLRFEEVDRYVGALKNLLESPTVTYKVLITAIYLMEAVYLKWAQNAIDQGIIPENLAYKYKEWIVLHSGEGFTSWTQFLKTEVDRVGDDTVESVFVEFCELEFEFFDKCYKYAESR